MHRTNRVPHAPLGALLVLGLLLGGAETVRAQNKPVDEVAPPPRLAGSRPLNVPVGSTIPVQMKGKLPIATVVNQKEGVARVTPIANDPNTVQVTGLTPGMTTLTLTSQPEAGKPAVTEIIEVTVELDVGLLRSLVRQTVPTAMVNVIPGAGNSIILTGTVNRSEDVEAIMGIARSVVGSAVGTGAGAGQAGAQIINALRVGGVMQVQLDVVVAVVSRQEIRKMDFTFERQGYNSVLSSTIGGNLQLPAGSTTPQLSTTGAGGTTGGASSGPLTITNIASSPLVFLGLGTAGVNPLFLFMDALRENDLAKIIAEPHLVALSGHPAIFLSGGQQAVPQVSGFGGTAGVQFEPFGTQVTFLPMVLGNGKIYIDVLPSVSQLNAANGVQLPGGGGLVPGRVTNQVQTSVIVEDGQTFAIGGLIQHTVQASTVKYPWLGDLPFLGMFFSRKEFTDAESELVILVTPHLVDPMDCKQVPRFLPGMESRNPDDFELFLEGILEAPRGPREVNQKGHYVASWKNSPTAQCFPCLGGPGNPTPCYPKNAPCGGSATPEAILGAGQGTPPNPGQPGILGGGCCGPTAAAIPFMGNGMPTTGPVMGMVSPADAGSAQGTLLPTTTPAGSR